MDQKFHFEKDFTLHPRIKASENFADRVIDRIEDENSPKIVHMPIAYKIMSVASMLFICISIGVLIGNNSNPKVLLKNKSTQKVGIEQFRDTYHLYTISKTESRLYSTTSQ